MILGLTGGLGCGKSTAARYFEQRGFKRLDSDAMIREQIMTRPEVVKAIKAHFGDDTVAPDGTIDRPRLAEIIFAEASAREWLEQLTHPLLFSLWRKQMNAEPNASWIVEVPLLFEKQLENWFDFIACVTCSLPQQLSRLEQRGLSRALAAQRISSQLPLARKMDLSDFVLLNEGSPEFLQAQIDELIDACRAARP